MARPPESPPAREALVPAGSATLLVRVVGRGRPILVLHGGPDFDHRYLLPELDLLAGAGRLVYYDQRGRGRSASGVRPEDVTIDSEVEDLDRVRAWAGAEAVAVVGHSWGGLLACEYATRHPERVAQLVLLNTAPCSHAGLLAFRAALAERLTAADAARMRDLRASPAYAAGDIAAEAEVYDIHFGPALRDPVRRAELLRRLRQGFTPDGILLARAIEERLYDRTWNAEEYDLLPALGRLRAPALVLHGADDFVPVGVAAAIATAIPDGRLVVLETGHFSYLEQPERVRAEVEAFLAR